MSFYYVDAREKYPADVIDAAPTGMPAVVGPRPRFLGYQKTLRDVLSLLPDAVQYAAARSVWRAWIAAREARAEPPTFSFLAAAAAPAAPPPPPRVPTIVVRPPNPVRSRTNDGAAARAERRKRKPLASPALASPASTNAETPETRGATVLQFYRDKTSNDWHFSFGDIESARGRGPFPAIFFRENDGGDATAAPRRGRRAARVARAGAHVQK